MVIPVEKLRELIELVDGKLYWLPRGIKNWDTCNAGKEAFTTNRSGYKAGQIFGKKYLAHRVIWALHYGEWPTKHLDHVDGNPLNNLIDNLRESSQQENMFNRRPSANKSSAFKGVSWHKNSKKWRSYITVDDKHISLGYFNEEVAAAKAYDVAAKVLFGAFAKGNVYA